MKKLLLLIALVTGLACGEEPQIVCGNLVYGKNQTSICFADKFLTTAAGATGLKIAPRFARLKLATEEVFTSPLCIFTGEGNFTLSETERKNLKRYVMNGGFIIVSPGCSDAEWNKAFRRELAAVFPAHPIEPLKMDHELFSMVHTITEVRSSRQPVQLYGITVNDRLAILYSPEGLNDSSNAKGCCCCGGSQIKDCAKINVNALVYALVH